MDLWRFQLGSRSAWVCFKDAVPRRRDRRELRRRLRSTACAERAGARKLTAGNAGLLGKLAVAGIRQPLVPSLGSETPMGPGPNPKGRDGGPDPGIYLTARGVISS